MLKKGFWTGIVLVSLWAPLATNALPRDNGDVLTPALTRQSQTFVSPTTSLIRQAEKTACMQSAGSDWKRETTAVQSGSGIRADFRTLRANTPFVSYVQPMEGATLLRIGVGFRISEDSLAISLPENALPDLDFRIEARGDTIVLRDPDDIAQMRAALGTESGVTVSARSQKLVPGAQEHVISHVFRLAPDPDGMSKCSEMAGKPQGDLRLQLHLGMKPVSGDIDREVARAVACNRDIDPTGAELVAFDTLEGFALPLSHGLVKRDDKGNIQTIWAGDLLRIERKDGAYRVLVSNSVRTQGPMSTQRTAACTRMAAPACVTMTESRDGLIGFAECVPDYLALATPSGIGPLLPSGGATPTYGGSGSGGGFFGGGGSGISGGGGGGPIYVETTNVIPDASDVDPVSIIGTNGDDGQDPTDPDPVPSTPPAIIPLPSSLALIALGIGLLGWTARSRQAL